MDEQIKQTLEQINWDFSDYNSTKYPLDINSIHWYLATFPPLIPMYLISLLSEEGDIVLDPFGGAGTTAIEALRLNRRFIYNDLNPFAVDILKAKIAIVERSLDDPDFLAHEWETLQKYPLLTKDVPEFLNKHQINADVVKWYEPITLSELCTIFSMIYMNKDANEFDYQIRRCAFSSILKAACSQNDHITYITDNCWPRKLIYKDAIKLYTDQIESIRLSAIEFHKKYNVFFRDNIVAKISRSSVFSSDSKQMPWLEDSSVDLVVTSPPYLCSQDYIKTMRLTNMFFPNENVAQKMQVEIGPRRKRENAPEKIINEYYSDMDSVFSEIHRVLRTGKYFCLIIGKGSGKITKSYDIISYIQQSLQSKYSFSLEYSGQRNIWSRRIHVGGVSEETILIFKKLEVAR